MKYKIADKTCQLFIDKAIYSSTIIHKCFYWYTGDFDVDIESYDGNLYQINLVSKTGLDYDFELIIERFRQDLIDFKLRELINLETQTIRELIIAKAFANYDIDTDDPTSEISDPVGFNPALL